MNTELVSYIESEIFPEYALNDAGHQIEHIQYVIRRSLSFASEVPGINLDMVYTIAAYHDVTVHINRKMHEVLSAQRLIDDSTLRRFFTDDQIKVMAEAIEDHRGSSDHVPRSVYGEIVSSADRNTSLDDALRRTYQYRLKNMPWLTLKESMNDSRKLLLEKFGPNGYAREKMFFNDPEYNKFLEDLVSVTSNDDVYYNRYKIANALI